MADKRVDLAYTPAGQLAAITRYADLAGASLVAASSYTYDPLSELTTLVHAGPAGVLAAYGWSYDAGGRVTSFGSLADGTSVYAYDPTDQLVAAEHSYQPDEDYSYDAGGNRTLAGYATGDNNRLLSDGVYLYEYDAEGNRTRRTLVATGAVTEYVWDHRNRLVAVIDKDAQGTVQQTVAYAYDPFNRRIARRVDEDGDGQFDFSQQFLYDDRWLAAGSRPGFAAGRVDDVLLDFTDADGQGPGSSDLDKRYLHGPAIDQLLAQESAAESLGAAARVLWQLTDNLASVRDLVDHSGAAAAHFAYDAYGNVTSASDGQGNPLSDPAAPSRYLYTSREHDTAAGLQYNRARWYDPIGIYTSMPI